MGLPLVPRPRVEPPAGSRPATKRSLLVLSRAMERAFDRGGAGLVVALFQERRHFDAEVQQYGRMAAAGCTVVVAFAGPVDHLPAGVVGVQLSEDEPLQRAWAVALVSPSLGTSLLAEDTGLLAAGEATLQASRLFSARWTFDRHGAVADARSLLQRLADRLPVEVRQQAAAHLATAAATPVTLAEAQLVAAAEHLVTSVDAGALRASAMRAELERTRALAERDHLTGLHNRVFLERFLEGAGRSPGTGVLLVDVDDLKGVNDRLGHRAGDAAIATVAACLRDSCRSGDVLVRWGGDEFLLLLPGAGRAGAVRTAERIAAAVRAARVPAPWQDVRLSVSIGVSGEATDPLPLDALDRALAVVKGRGKGSVQLADALLAR